MALESDIEVDELANLRTRAYGPHADIGDDPAAQARLLELERADRAGRSLVEAVPEQGREQGPERAPGQASGQGPEQGPQQRPEEALELAPEHPPADAVRTTQVDSARWSRLRSRLPWIVAAVAVVVAIVTVTVTVSSELARPRPELSFAVSELSGDARRPALDSAMLDYWGVPNTALDFRGTVGNLDVWTMEGDDGVGCLFFSSHGDMWGQNCTLDPLAPMVEFRTSIDSIPVDSLSPAVPPGSLIRFVWESDRVDVYIARLDDLRAA